MILEELRRRAASLTILYEGARRSVESEQERLREAESKLVALREAQRLVQMASQRVQESAHGKIASVVTRCLRAVMDDPYEFSLKFVQRRGRTECDLLFLRGGREYDSGGGETSGLAMNVASFALRLACLMLARPKARRLLVLDEPMKDVNGRANQARVCELLETLSEEMEVQMIIVSDNWLKIGKIHRLGNAPK